MGFLKDTCVFIDNINEGEEILKVARHCKLNGKTFCVTDIVMDELKPGRRIEEDKAEVSKNIIQYLNFGDSSKIVKILKVTQDNTIYKRNFDKIRSRYYSHLKDKDFIKEQIEKGEITREQAKSKNFIRKDYGECSCIAIAMEEPNKFIIVSKDKGRIFLKPKTNLFEKYKKSHNIVVWNYKEWVKNTRYDLGEIAAEG